LGGRRRTAIPEYSDGLKTKGVSEVEIQRDEAPALALAGPDQRFVRGRAELLIGYSHHLVAALLEQLL